MSFLKAEWRKLAIVNYEVNPSVLLPFLPFGTELDMFEGKCYVSIVGFMFINTKVLGLKVPGHVNFEEVNLRFYVKHKHGEDYRRGVVFIKEIVPKRAITFMANQLYKENYETLPMYHNWTESEKSRNVKYGWLRNGKDNFIEVSAQLEKEDILGGSITEFITEHYWGYASVSQSTSNEYEVTHPKWQHYPVLDYSVHVDFEKNYGKGFRFLQDMRPSSVMLAEGSLITVESKTKLK